MKTEQELIDATWGEVNELMKTNPDNVTRTRTLEVKISTMLQILGYSAPKKLVDSASMLGIASF